MRDRTSPVARAVLGPAGASLDLICCSADGPRLTVLVCMPPAGARGELPWVALETTTALDASAQRLARSTLGKLPAWLAQVGAFGGATRHPSSATLSVSYVAVVPTGTGAPPGTAWLPIAAGLPLGPRQQGMVVAAIATLRDRMDLTPVAFRLLPERFTLSELQVIYELLLDRGLHKASFRRALQGAYLVAPTDEWRSEGRGRPAQLFRYSPRKRRGIRRPVRFELLA